MRLNALFVILLTVAGIVFQSALYPLFLMADFLIRGFTQKNFSPLSVTSKLPVNAFRLNEKTIDKAPKIFAARLGFLMTLVISVLFIIQLNTAAIVISAVLLFFATLEFALGICVDGFEL